MIEVNLKQGSHEWHAFRAEKFPASEASAAMGLSKYKSRDQLLTEKSTGIVPEVTPELQRIFNKGHETEDLARVILEAETGEELYPVTGYHDTNVKISASLDGMDMLGSFLFEHKLYNKGLVDFIETNNDLPETHWPQVEQQLYVSGAERCEFVVSDGTAEKRVIHTYTSKPERLQSVLEAWDQFAIDLENYEAKAPEVKKEAKRIDTLPVLAIEIDGSVKSSNLATYKDTLLARIDGINTELSTDQDFADAEAMVKFCKKAEDELKNAEKLVLGQVADINQAISTIKDLAAAMRDKRLVLDKSVKSRKEQIKIEMINEASEALFDHINKINQEFSGVSLPLIPGNFADAIKGKKNLDSMQSAINDQLANCKIEANKAANVMRDNLNMFEEYAGGYASLFPDLQQVIFQDSQSFIGLIQFRIGEHEKSEKLRKEAEAQRQAEQQARAEQQAKAIEEANQLAAEILKPTQPAEVERTDSVAADIVSTELPPVVQAIQHTDYQSLDIWPSDIDRAENEELERLCQKLEEAEAFIEELTRKLTKAA